jgi:predicted nucleotidyltransferase
MIDPKVIDTKIQEHIQKRLTEIEREHTIEILLAVESGSRAWGFESTDSDYDVRFIYRHSIDWYLTIFPGRDVIEYPIIDEYDYAGWDLRKALGLMYKGNPVLFEWFRSPIVYRKSSEHFTALFDASHDFFKPKSSVFHYLHMARGNFKEHLRRDQVKLKKYFYMLRPVLSCLWIQKYNESPPIEFDRLLTLLDEETNLVGAIDALLEVKKSSKELGLAEKIEVIDVFLEQSLKTIEQWVGLLNKPDPVDDRKLDDLFLKLIKVRR